MVSAAMASQAAYAGASGMFTHAAPTQQLGSAMPRASSFGVLPGDLRQDSYGGLRFARDADEDDAVPEPVEIAPWRMRERMKTTDVGLVLCLNIGTDPPDVVRSPPYARKECWVDPFSMPAQKALETIGRTLQSQYERWQSKARYRLSLDPTVEEVKQLAVSLRRHAKQDRVLFHYNGHGVPRPTQNAEIWVFNKSYTQYIPLLVYDLQLWVGTPAIYVFDCSAAGILLPHFNNETSPNTAPGLQGEAIVLAACGANETLPTNPDLCADVFTSCLTTPITIALRWFIAQNQKSMPHLDASFIDRIPGKLIDRKTPLGELNWIFTAISDTIAWNILPRDLFQKLFRQDLLVASLFRNFLLAERIMKSEGCTPCSLPALPPTSHHPLWQSWDLAAEICLNQLYRISHPHPYSELSFQTSRFFAEQLTAFEVWLQFGAASKPPPQQLPMVLQVLLSQVHRLRALVLLKKFLDLGPWAVNLALSVGIFPYVLKLLQSPASELRQVLVFIWVKILALDSTCQLDLVKDEGHSYFITHLAAGMQAPGATGSQYGTGPSAMPADQKVMATFVLSAICNDCPQGQKSCVQQYLHRICANILSDPHDEVRRWACLCLGKLWENFEDAKRIAIDDRMPRLLSLRLQDDRPEVRAAAAYAIGTLVGLQFEGSLYGPQTDRNYVDEFLKQRAHNDLAVAAELLWGCQDASPFVRRESVLALANVVIHTYHQPKFEAVARHYRNRPRDEVAATTQQETADSSTPQPATAESEETAATQRTTVEDAGATDKRFPVGVGLAVDDEIVAAVGADAKYYVHIWHVLKELQAHDPFPQVVQDVKAVVRHVYAAVLAAEKLAAAQPQEATANGDGSSSPRSNSRSMQREGSAPDLPAHSPRQLPPRSTNGTADRVPGSDGHHSVPLGAAVTTASGGTMRPTQSVGNLRVDEQPPATGARFRGVSRASTGDATALLQQQQQQQQQQRGWATASAAAAPPPLPTHGRHADFPHSLVSTLYDRQKRRFNEPMLEPVNESDDPLSERGAEKLERHQRYERIRKAALRIAPGFPVNSSMAPPSMDRFTGRQPGSSSASSMAQAFPPSSQSFGSGRFGSSSDKYDSTSFSMTLRQRAVLNNEAEMTSLLLFHPYEKMLVIADEKDQISLYNFEHSEKKALSFANKNPPKSRLTSLSWINEAEESLLTCGSDDGVVRIYHGLHSPQAATSPPTLRTAFAAVPDLVASTRGSGLVTHWQQQAGMLFAGGNSSVLRGWNLRHERCAFAMATETDACVTTVTSDETTASNLVVAGFGDGSLRLFDVRASRSEFTVKSTMKEHLSWVVQAHLYPGKHELLSASVTGELKFWDVRYPKTSLRSLEAHRSPMTALAVHEYAPLLASGSHNQFIKVFRTDGEQLALIRYHEGFLGERIGPVSCLAFHPHRLLLAAGATDSVIAIYSAEK